MEGKFNACRKELESMFFSVAEVINSPRENFKVGYTSSNVTISQYSTGTGSRLLHKYHVATVL